MMHWVNDQNPMGSPEVTGNKPQNHGLSEFKILTEKRGVGPRVQKPGEPKQQPSDPNREAFERFFRRGPMKPAVLEGIPPRRHNRESNQPRPQNLGEQRGLSEQSQSSPPEQQTPQRQRSRVELSRLAQDPELRGLAKELFGGITERAASRFIEMAVQDNPELPPDEALRKLDRDLREGPFSGFTFP